VGVARKSPVSVWFSDTLAAGAQLTVRDGTNTLQGTTALDSTRTRLTWTPSSAMPSDSLVTVALTGVASEEGAVMGNQTWTFRTRAPDTTAAQSMFGDEIPQVDAASEGAPVEVGTAFTPSRDGTVKAIRFFKGEGNLGTHTGSLWKSDGTRLATVTFANETTRGWQTANLAEPVNVTAGSTYIVSYLAPQGHYSYTSGFFNNAWTAGDLTAPSGANGRYLYGAAGGMPQYSWGSANYFVDVVFERAPASLTVTDLAPNAGATDVSTSAKPSISLSAPLAPGWDMKLSRSGTAIAGNAALSTDGQKITFTPSAALPSNTDVTVTVTGLLSTDGATMATQTWTFKTEAGSTVLTSLFGVETPSNPSMNDTDAVELGTAFTPSDNGDVTAIKFYKGSGNTGTHTGSIWSSTGTRLATVTFANETATGWQTATLATPVSLTAGQTYVVSYFAPNGRYSGTPGYFYNTKVSGPLTAPGGSNGRYRYGATGGFPNSSYNSTNYFVDVVFRSASTSP
jgi:hypothetical protein